MKKICIIATVAILAMNVNAQNRMGIKTGANIANISASEVTEGDVHIQSGSGSVIMGLAVGFYDNYSFNKFFGIQAEVLFSMQGDTYTSETEETNKETGEIVIVKKSVVEHFNYVTFPILLEIKPITADFSIFAGPQFGFNVFNSLIIGDRNISGANLDYYYKDQNSKLNTFDLSAVIGVQYLFMDQVAVSFRYVHGFTSVLESTSADRIMTGGKNRVFQLGLGLTF
jgi:hypothetical protein